MIVCPPVLDCYISTLDVPGIAQALAECRHKMCDLIGWLCTQIADYRGLLLGDCRERPCRRCTAEQRDELAALHSITSSARASSVSGTSIRNDFAVLRLMRRWNFVGNITGNSDGFSPLTMRPA